MKINKKYLIIGTVVLVGVILSIYFYTKDNTETTYVNSVAKIQDIKVSVSGTGQVIAKNTAELKSKVSGDIVSVYKKAGDPVNKGEIIASIDSTEASFELESARISYEKTITIDRDDLVEAENSYSKSEIDLKTSYVQARATLTSTSIVMSDLLNDLKDLFSNDGYLNTNSISDSRTRDLAIKANNSYYSANNLYKDFSKNFQAISSNSTDKDIELILEQAYQVSLAISQSSKYSKDTITYMKDRSENSSIEDAFALISTITSSADGVVTDIANGKKDIESAKNTFSSAKINLNDIKNGPDVLDERNEKLTLATKQEVYNNHFIVAPFSGIVAAVEIDSGDEVSSGESIATVISNEKRATISLNEVDAAKVKQGNIVNLSFDAIENYFATGTIYSIDLIGTVSQGVVSYDVDIDFKADDTKIRPGMTISAEVFIDQKNSVIAVPVSAVKTQGRNSYVEVLDKQTNKPVRVNVVTGISNDDFVEIIEGLKEGDSYISRSIVSKSSTTPSAPTANIGSTNRSGQTGMQSQRAFFR